MESTLMNYGDPSKLPSSFDIQPTLVHFEFESQFGYILSGLLTFLTKEGTCRVLSFFGNVNFSVIVTRQLIIY